MKWRNVRCCMCVYVCSWNAVTEFQKQFLLQQSSTTQKQPDKTILTTDIHSPGVSRTFKPSRQRRLTHALGLSTTEMGVWLSYCRQFISLKYHRILFVCLYRAFWLKMFISIPTNAHRISITLILKLLRHVSVFLHHPQAAYSLCQLKLWIIELIE